MMLRMYLAGFLSLVTSASHAELITLNFDTLSGYTDTGVTGSYFNGYGFGATSGSWSTGGVTFNTNEYGPGWSYSNVNDTTTAGFTNQFAAFSGTDVSGTGNYVIGTSYTDNEAYFNLPEDYFVNSLRVTNSTYAALSMRDGDAFADPFGGASGDVADYFKVRFTGFSNLGATGSVTGSQELLLADYQFADQSLDYIVDQWITLDLTPLGNARSVGIGFETTAYNLWGPATPTYVAIDDLVLETAAVPEPSSWLMLATAALLPAYRRYRRPLPRN